MNAVYGSCDRQGRINRRVSRERHSGVVVEGRYDTKRIAYSHEDIIYVAKYVGMTKEHVENAIMPLLKTQLGQAMEDSDYICMRI